MLIKDENNLTLKESYAVKMQKQAGSSYRKIAEIFLGEDNQMWGIELLKSAAKTMGEKWQDW